MRRAITVLAWVIAGIWAVIVFTASNTPTDVTSRTSEWLALPIVGQLPSKITNFVSSPWILASSFFLIGSAVGWRLAKRPKVGSRPKWWYELGNELAWMAHRISEIDLNSNIDKLNADLNVLAVKVSKQGLSFPSSEKGFVSFQSLLPYLNQVSAYLKANEIDHARNAANRLSQQVP